MFPAGTDGGDQTDFNQFMDHVYQPSITGKHDHNLLITRYVVVTEVGVDEWVKTLGDSGVCPV